MDVFKRCKQTVVICGALALSVLSTIAAAGGVGLGATRVVYPSDSKQVALSVTNSDKNNVYLLQSWVDKAEGGLTQDFMVTPPLFVIKKMSGNAPTENTLRLVYTGAPLAADRETLFWVNVKAIPSSPKAEDNGQGKLKLAIVSRIKMFYRPKELAQGLELAAPKVTSERVGNTVTFTNPTPYYISLAKVSIGEHELSNAMIAPFAKAQVIVPAAAKGELNYSYISDYGGAIKIK